MLLFTALGPYHPPHICSQSRGLCFYLQYLGLITPHICSQSRGLCCYLRCLGPITLTTYVPKVEVYIFVCNTWASSPPTYMLPKSWFMLLFMVLGPYLRPHIRAQSRGLYFALQYLGLITLWALRVCSQSRGLCCYLRYFSPITLPTYGLKVEVYVFYLHYLGLITLNHTPHICSQRSRFMLLFTVFGPYHPPHICAKSRGLSSYLRYFGLITPHICSQSRGLCCYLRHLGVIVLFWRGVRGCAGGCARHF